jgi:hypothetical protein
MSGIERTFQISRTADRGLERTLAQSPAARSPAVPQPSSCATVPRAVVASFVPAVAKDRRNSLLIAPAAATDQVTDYDQVMAIALVMA